MNKQELHQLADSLTLEWIEEMLAHKVKSNAHECATSYSFFLNCEGVQSSMQTTGPEYLNENNISMRNVRGEWIKR